MPGRYPPSLRLKFFDLALQDEGSEFLCLLLLITYFIVNKMAKPTACRFGHGGGDRASVSHAANKAGMRWGMAKSSNIRQITKKVDRFSVRYLNT